ncbi:MAG: hypothetical protein M0Q44_20815 [Methylobacter sp.]|nr:hypothetical protein [Methylobacter sp.]
MPKQNTASFPKKPRLALQVGVTGHRPCRLPVDSGDLKVRIAETLQTIAQAYREFAATADAQTAYDAESPALRLLSPLAEGADRIAAVGGLAAGYELQCPLPFLRNLYIDDFAETPGSLDEFDLLLGKATKILELDGDRNNKPQAYRNVGHLVLNHSDLVLAIWDGEENPDSPGTPGMVAKARRIGLPIVWVNTLEPDKVQFLDPCSPTNDWQGFNKTVIVDFLNYCLLPPENSDASARTNYWGKLCPAPKDAYETYFSDPEPCRNLLGSLYRGFFALLGKTGRQRFNFFGTPYRQDAGDQWQTLTEAGSLFHFPQPVQEHFIRADSLASHYADKYRGTFVGCFVLGGFAVLCALLGGPFAGFSLEFKLLGPWFATLELTLILLVLLLIHRGRHQDYHRRWLDYRLLAERLRQAAFLMPIGIVPHGSLPAYESREDRDHAWIEWFAQAVIRSDGMSNGIIDAGHRQNYRDYLCRIVAGQVAYHHTNAEQNERIVHTLHYANLMLLGLIITACAVHIFHLVHADTELTIAATVLPAFGATIAGILSQGEFNRIAHRSGGMATHLAKIENCLKTSSPTAEFLVEQASQVIAILSQELSDWRIIFRVKPLEIHA